MRVRAGSGLLESHDVQSNEPSVTRAGRKVQTLKELDQNGSLIDVASSRVGSR